MVISLIPSDLACRTAFNAACNIDNNHTHIHVLECMMIVAKNLTSHLTVENFKQLWFSGQPIFYDSITCQIQFLPTIPNKWRYCIPTETNQLWKNNQKWYVIVDKPSNLFPPRLYSFQNSLLHITTIGYDYQYASSSSCWHLFFQFKCLNFETETINQPKLKKIQISQLTKISARLLVCRPGSLSATLLQQVT